MKRNLREWWKVFKIGLAVSSKIKLVGESLRGFEKLTIRRTMFAPTINAEIVKC